MRHVACNSALNFGWVGLTPSPFRSVSGTPTFFVNGISVDADPSWALADWQQVPSPPRASAADRSSCITLIGHATHHTQFPGHRPAAGAGQD
jgi:hypothetical protein